MSPMTADTRQLLKIHRRVDARLQTQGFRAYLRDMLPTARERVEAERMLDTVIEEAIREAVSSREGR